MSKRHSDPPPDHARPYEVAPNLFISGHPDHSKDFLSQGIHAVVDLEGDIDTAIPEAEEQEQTTLYVYWPIEDGPMPAAATVRSLAALLARLISEDRRALVHCRSGHNRSGLLCARTLIETGMTAEDAIRVVRDKRGDGHALENDDFVRWLSGESPP